MIGLSGAPCELAPCWSTITAVSKVKSFLEDGVGQGCFPSYSYIIARGEGLIEEGAGGAACLVPGTVAANTDTIYDLASLTKPLVTAVLALILRRQRLIRFEDDVRRFIPAYEWDGRREIQIHHLLTHASGLPDWEPIYLFGYERKEIFRGLDRVDLEYTPGADARYSCLGYIQLGRILEQAGGATLDQLFSELIARPLRLECACFNPASDLIPRTAATEGGNDFERRKCGDRAAGYEGFRKEMIRATVHDHNCYSLGGVTGNAGLFATARDVRRIAAEILRPEVVLRPEDAGLFFDNLTGSFPDHRSIGLQLQSARDAVAGPAMSKRAGAHTGFTGTSLAIDPASNLILILLTNRIHPEYKELNMNEQRRRFHEAAVECVERGVDRG